MSAAMSATSHHSNPIGKQRVEALSDGLYSIALTLLVLELKLPALPENVSDAVLRHALLDLSPKLLAWLLSFWVLVLNWMLQQRLYRYADMLDREMVRIELILLALISLLPFTTALIGEFGSRASAAALYSFHLVAISALSVLRVWHFERHPEMHNEHFTEPVARRVRIRTGVFLVCALLCFALAFVVPPYNMFGMLPAALAPFLARDSHI